MLLLAAITADNTASAFVLDYRIVTGQISNDPAVLLGSGAAIFTTNVIVFGIWYWTIDLGVVALSTVALVIARALNVLR